MAFCVIIPARLGSTRLPDKPLADIGGQPMVVRVAQRAARSAAHSVHVATDSPRIAEACAAHGVAAILTRSDHPTGTDRLAEACERLALPDDALVVNVQGDEPLIDPGLIDTVAALALSRPDCAITTAAHPLDDAADWLNPNVVKVVTDAAGNALLFSRAPIPCWRDAPGATALPAEPRPLRHIGLYAYRAGFLRRFPGLAPAPIERCEALEQLRALWHGERIAVREVAHGPPPGVDTADDLARVRAAWAADPGDQPAGLS